MIKNLIKKNVIRKKEYSIRKKAIIGKNIQFSMSSGIVNAGLKENIVLGNHGCFFGILQAYYSGKIVVGDNVWIGKNEVIMKGVIIGKGSIVGLSSVVTHNVPEYCIVAGNPATVVKKFR